MHFDVIFLDTTAYKYYDHRTIEEEGLGGSESSLVRVAESLGERGLSVLILQGACPPFDNKMGRNVYIGYGPHVPADTTCDHFVQFRRNLNPNIFPGARKYLWLQDFAFNDDGFSASELSRENIKVIGASQWHQSNIRSFLGYDNVTFVYNPVEDQLFRPHSDYDPNLLVWTASPHKGLKNALRIFQRIREKNSSMRLAVFNPGYCKIEEQNEGLLKNVTLLGESPPRKVWETVKQALAVFYPCEWDETFGLIVAEANAMGTPVATYGRAALNEVVSSDIQLLNVNDEDGLIRRVLEWNACGRPIVAGKPEFRLSRIAEDWCRILGTRPKPAQS